MSIRHCVYIVLTLRTKTHSMAEVRAVMSA